MKRFRRHYAPWNKDLLLFGVGVFTATLILGVSLRTAHLSLASLVAAGAGGLIAVHALRNYKRRTHGKHLEGRAQRALGRAAQKSGLDLRCNVPCPYGGDIDAVLVGSRGRYAVEIKSWHGLRERHGELVKMNGSALPKDPIPQCHREADSLRATPLLWLPDAKGGRYHARVFVYRGVIVVNGSAQALVRHLRQAEGL